MNEQLHQLVDCVKQLTDTVATMLNAELELVAEVSRLKRQTGELELMLEESETYIGGIKSGPEHRKEPLVTPVIEKTDYLGRGIGDVPQETTFNRVLNSIKQTVNHNEEATLEKDAST